jgi:hypothetical protein
MQPYLQPKNKLHVNGVYFVLVKWYNCFCVWISIVILYNYQKMVFQMLSSWWISLFYQSLNRDEMWKNNRDNKSLAIWFWGWKLYNDHATFRFWFWRSCVNFWFCAWCYCGLSFIFVCIGMGCANLLIQIKKERRQAINEMKLTSRSFFLVAHILMIVVALCIRVKFRSLFMIFMQDCVLYATMCKNRKRLSMWWQMWGWVAQESISCVVLIFKFLFLCYWSEEFQIMCKRVVDKLRYVRKGG